MNLEVAMIVEILICIELRNFEKFENTYNLKCQNQGKFVYTLYSGYWHTKVHMRYS